MKAYTLTDSVKKSRPTLKPVKVDETQSISDALQIAKENPVENSIKRKLMEAFQPVVLNVINESYMHSVPKGSETHFKVVVVAETFDSLPLIKRHRLVNEALQEELQTGVHALSIVAKTPKQWEDSDGKVSKSPACMGGAGL